MTPPRPRLAAALLLPWLLGGCAVLELEPLPEPIRPARAPAGADATDPAPPPEEETPAVSKIVRTPGVVIQRTVAEGIVDRLGEDLTGDPIRVSFHDVPLVAFINAVFGEELGMSFVISPGLRDKTDLVTLKLTSRSPPASSSRPPAGSSASTGSTSRRRRKASSPSPRARRRHRATCPSS